MIKLAVAVLLCCIAYTSATDARGYETENQNYGNRGFNGPAPYGSYQPQKSYSGAMTRLPTQSNGQQYDGQQQSFGNQQGNMNEQMMGGQPMANYANRGMAPEQMMGSANYQGGQMQNQGMMGQMQNPGMAGQQGMVQPMMSGMPNEQMMAPQQGFGMNPEMNEQMMGQPNMAQPNMMANNPMAQNGMPMNGMNPMMAGQNPAMVQGGFQQPGFGGQPQNFGGQQQPNPQMMNEEVFEDREAMAQPQNFGAPGAFN